MILIKNMKILTFIFAGRFFFYKETMENIDFAYTAIGH